MANLEFQFNFKFNLHKSCIPVGIDDHDYPRLSVVYGVPEEELMEEVRQTEAGNRAEAELLIAGKKDALAKLSGKRIAFLGDSITSDRASYFNILRTALEGYDVQLLDDSISGYKLVDIITSLVPNVTGFNADIVHIMIGSNDMKRTTDGADMILFSPEEYERDLNYLLQVLTKCGAKVIISTIPPFDLPKIKVKFWDANVQYFEEDRARFNAIVRGKAAQWGCMLNEMDPTYSGYTTDELTRDDGLHLNALGQRLMVNAVLDKLAEAAQ